MINGYDLRGATEADAATVQALFKEHLQTLGYTADPDLDADMTDFPRAYITPGNCFIVVVTGEGEVVAMGGLKDGEIRRLFVRPAHQGKGLARMILLRLLQSHLSNGKGRLWSIVSRSNLPVYGSFYACGFLGTGRTPDHPKMVHCEMLEMQPPQDPQLPTAVVTGGSRGLGEHLVQDLAKNFRMVFTWQTSMEKARSTVQAVQDAGGWALPVQCNVTQPRHLEFLAELTAAVAGACQVLIHNVGHYSMKRLEEVTEESWRLEMDTTATAAFWAFRAFESQLLSRPRGRMITIGDSSADKMRGFTKSLGYYVGKHGVLMVTKAIASHWQGKSATCNCVSPGVMLNSIDLNEPGMAVNVQFDEIAGVIRFLLSPAGDAVSGANLVASRGWNV